MQLAQHIDTTVLALNYFGVGQRRFSRLRVAERALGRVGVLDEIPKGPTHKIQRIGLAAKLGLTS